MGGAFETPNDRLFHLPAPRPSIEATGTMKYVVFSVRAKNDAHIKLFSGDSYYSFIFGGSQNTQCWVRRNTDSSKYPGTLVNVAPLDADVFVDLWVSVDLASGRVAAGRGKQVGEDVITEFVDEEVIDPKDYFVRTGWGATGTWLCRCDGTVRCSRSVAGRRIPGHPCRLSHSKSSTDSCNNVQAFAQDAQHTC